ncbi:MAG TPA: hypothetical protein VGB48_09865 [Allosphingosinicella sp.]|jgi:hypothetical protein
MKVSLHQRREIEGMLELSRTEGPARRVIEDWLVKRAIQLWPRRTGLRFFQRTNNSRRWLLVSYHHPARLCWSWLVDFAIFPPLKMSGFRHIIWRWQRSWGFRVPGLFEVAWRRQDYDYMLSRNGRRRLICLVLNEGAAQ